MKIFHQLNFESSRNILEKRIISGFATTNPRENELKQSQGWT